MHPSANTVGGCIVLWYYGKFSVHLNKEKLLLILFRGFYYDRGESSIKTSVDLNRGWGKRSVNHAPLSSLPLKQQEVLRDEMAMGLGDGEYMIADCNRLALDAIHVVGIDD